MFTSLVAWVEKYAEHKHAKKALALVAFTESSFFPIPPFVLIIAMLAKEKKVSWIKLALIGTFSSVLGGIFGYCIGTFFYGYIGAPLVALYGMTEEVGRLGQLFKDHVFVTIILASLSPLPYKVFTLSAGLFSVNIVSFIIASIIGRGIRFFIVSYISDRYGLRARNGLMQNQKIVTFFLYSSIVVLILYILLKSKGIL
jgi:membrane protein YqaA with SNARE-associated domain